jgi:hypothetical protein
MLSLLSTCRFIEFQRVFFRNTHYCYAGHRQKAHNGKCCGEG